MKELPPEALAQLQGSAPVIAGAMRIVLPSATHRLWTGYGDLPVEGQPFKGIGARALITPISSQIGGAADGLTITLSQLTPEIAATIEFEDYHQKPITIWRLVFGPDTHTLLGLRVFMRGRLDTVAIREQVGGEAALDFHVEGPRRDMNRSGARIRGDSDQRTLGGALDGAFRHISTVGRKTLLWGQKPTRGPALGVGGVLPSGPGRPQGFLG